MKHTGKLWKLLFLTPIFLTLIIIILYRYQGIRLNISSYWPMSSTMNMVGDGTQQLQEAISKPSYPVYYMWFTKKSFEFTNYLSVTSIIKHMEPDKIVLFYKDYPVVDPMLYNVWLADILEQYPFLETVKVPDTVCSTNDKLKQDFLRAYFKGFDRIQWEEHALLTSQPTKTNISDLIVNGTKFFANCSLASRIGNETILPLCIALDKYLYPKDIWELETSFGRSVRNLFYGVGEIRSPVPSYSQPAPNIAHVTWFGGGNMDFIFYLGILSLAYVAEVDKVFIYGEAPTGKYWSLLQKDNKVQMIPHVRIQEIFGKRIETFMHMSDILRVEVLKRYGGIYMDTDAIVVKKFDRELFAYDAVVSLDAMPSFYVPFPDVINGGVMIGKKDAKIWTIFQESMKQFRDNDPTYNACRRFYQLLERHPDLIHVDPRLQVECFQFKCHPTWWPDYRDPRVHHLSSKNPFDWKNDTYVMHWTSPTPNELTDPKMLLKATGMWADIGKYILDKSNMTRYFETH